MGGHGENLQRGRPEPNCRSVCCRDATEAPAWVPNASFISTSGGPVFLLVPLGGVLAKQV